MNWSSNRSEQVQRSEMMQTDDTQFELVDLLGPPPHKPELSHLTPTKPELCHRITTAGYPVHQPCCRRREPLLSLCDGTLEPSLSLCVATFLPSTVVEFSPLSRSFHRLPASSVSLLPPSMSPPSQSISVVLPSSPLHVSGGHRRQ
ncbi:hypothetical protein PIB30_015620 [Stylosanthes scabra]|uniref:Uncharacterized protein n=1 Tax=Stylosanthes scabra TaxID=79078 RepID=A0ABU6S797_9FABA|nr:hypothetical protein [Stylosanthes scabra]